MTSYEKERSSGSPSGASTLPRSVAGALFAAFGAGALSGNILSFRFLAQRIDGLRLIAPAASPASTSVDGLLWDRKARARVPADRLFASDDAAQLVRGAGATWRRSSPSCRRWLGKYSQNSAARTASIVLNAAIR